MHRLSREIRFTVSPFSEQAKGENSYCSKPDCEGLGVFLSLWLELGGEVSAKTGFVVNLTDIDELCRKKAVPIICKSLRAKFLQGESVSFYEVAEILADCFEPLKGEFLPAKVLSLTLNINPYRKIKVLADNKKVIYYSEKFEFAATHKLWNDKLCSEENFAVFGKCANPSGHGHNYIVEITVEIDDSKKFTYGSFEKSVDDNLIEILDHKNLNADVPYFADNNPTVENITTYAWQQLVDAFNAAKLAEITIWENDRAYCTYKGER